MLRKVALFVLLPITVVALFFSFPTLHWMDSGSPKPSLSTLNAVRQFSLLLEEYSQREESKGQYPKDLYGLVAVGLLQQSDYEKLMKNKQIGYFPPLDGKPDQNHILLLAGAGSIVAYSTVSGIVDVLPNNK